MTRVNLNSFLTATALSALFLSLSFAAPARADDGEYCREFTKTITIDGKRETGYGTACEQQDGSWAITSSRGRVDPFDDLRSRDVVLVAPRKVYYDYGPALRPVTYYPSPYYYARPGYRHSHGGISFIFVDRDNDWDRGNRHWRRHRNWDGDHGHSHHGRGHHHHDHD